MPSQTSARAATKPVAANTPTSARLTTASRGTTADACDVSRASNASNGLGALPLASARSRSSAHVRRRPPNSAERRSASSAARAKARPLAKRRKGSTNSSTITAPSATSKSVRDPTRLALEKAAWFAKKTHTAVTQSAVSPRAPMPLAAAAARSRTTIDPK